MRSPKQKLKMIEPKLLDRTLCTHDRVQSVYTKTKEQLNDSKKENENNYATDQVMQTGTKIALSGSKEIIEDSKKIANNLNSRAIITRLVVQSPACDKVFPVS